MISIQIFYMIQSLLEQNNTLKANIEIHPVVFTTLFQ